MLYLCAKQGRYGRREPPKRLIGRGELELGAAWGMLWRRLKASGEPAGRSLSHVVFDIVLYGRRRYFCVTS